MPYHETLVFDRQFSVTVSAAYSALADVDKRIVWSAPTDTSVFFYEAEDFRVGGQDLFRCGNKDNPNVTGRVTYVSIVPEQSIVTTEVISIDDTPMMVSINTLALKPHDAGTNLKLTVQVTSFYGTDMIAGARAGNDAALNNLARFLEAGA